MGHGGGRDIGDALKPPSGLKYLQLYKQCHLGLDRSGHGWGPFALIEAWAEKLLQIARGQWIR
jgi:hypothetical protein